MYLTNGTLLQGGKYKIVRHISSGGFGNTYEAFDTVLNKHVAIKEFFVKDFCGRDSEKTLVTVTTPSKAPLIGHLKKKFMEEARAIANMEHENIVKVHALFEENGTAYYVMDYIDGESVHALLKRRGSLPESEALPIIRKVASALDYMHKQNRYHLDVKPANIMLRRDGKVILIDFGSSKQYAEVDGENTTTMAPCYTPGYAPSEQMNPTHTTFSAATDIYALGATLYKMLTGVTPPSAISLMNGDAKLSPLPGEVSKGVRESVQKAMRPLRSNRTQSIAEFVCGLKAGLPVSIGGKKPVAPGGGVNNKKTSGLGAGKLVKEVSNEKGTNVNPSAHSSSISPVIKLTIVAVIVAVILGIIILFTTGIFHQEKNVAPPIIEDVPDSVILDSVILDTITKEENTLENSTAATQNYEVERIKNFISKQVFNQYQYYYDEDWIKRHSSGKLRNALLEIDSDMGGELYLGSYLAGRIPGEDYELSVISIDYRDGFYYVAAVDEYYGLKRTLKYQAHLEGENVVLTSCAWIGSSNSGDFTGDICR